MNINKISKIYVKLINEDITVFKPVNGVHLENNIYKIIQHNPEIDEEYGEQWEYNYGDIVVCEEENKLLKAIKKAPKLHLHSIENLLELSSYPIKDSAPNKTNINNKNVYILLNHKNGFYAFESALHIFSDDELNEINTLIKSEKLYDNIENYICFAEDIFGNLFCLTGNKVYMLEVETGHLEYIADSLEGWAKEILKDYNFLTGYSLAQDWQKMNGKLDQNNRLVPKQFFVFGGKYTIENLEAKDRFDSLRYRSNIARELKNVKDGEHIILEKR